MERLSHAITIDQLTVLLEVVDAGGFTAAARTHRRTQGAVSYHIARLEEQLGLTLFDRSGRRPTLTESGNAIVRHSRTVLSALNDLVVTAHELQSGVEASLHVCVDALYPPAEMAYLLKAFESQFPSVALHVTTGVWRGPVEALQRGLANVAIAPSLAGGPMRSHPTAKVDFVPVVSADHPLAQRQGPVPLEVLGTHRRLLLTTNEPLPEDEGSNPELQWRLDNAATRRGLLLQGVGWARLARWQVAEDLAHGRLVAFEIDGWLGAPHIELAVMLDPKQASGPAARWLYALLASRGS
ncbi:MAG: LysR family transcriptional regulator [Myxococcota bacterium]